MTPSWWSIALVWLIGLAAWLVTDAIMSYGLKRDAEHERACAARWRWFTRTECPCGVSWCRRCCVSEHGDACPGDHPPVR